jgi:putative nucleotidyltransferase with HDIG domain
MSAQLSRDEAWSLLTEWVQSESLRRHCLAVATAMEAYAHRQSADADRWYVVGLLHDMDYERFPDMDDTEHGHPRSGMKELEARGVDPEIVRAIASHADFMGVPRETQLDKALFACDELAGFIAACAYVRPEGIAGMKPKSVKKKLKQPSFAAGVNRDDVYQGAAELEPETGMSFDEHLQFVIDALAEHAEQLGLTGRHEPATAD